jgi:cell division protein FtsL
MSRSSPARQWLGYGLVALLGLGLACAQIWTRLQVVATGYALSNTRHLMQTLEAEQRSLEAEWSRLTASGRLGRLARQRLGLGAPQAGQVKQIKTVRQGQ